MLNTSQSLENQVPPLLFFVLSQAVTEGQTVHTFDYKALKVNALGYVPLCTQGTTFINNVTVTPVLSL